MELMITFYDFRRREGVLILIKRRRNRGHRHLLNYRSCRNRCISFPDHQIQKVRLPYGI